MNITNSLPSNLSTGLELLDRSQSQVPQLNSTVIYLLRALNLITFPESHRLRKTGTFGIRKLCKTSENVAGLAKQRARVSRAKKLNDVLVKLKKTFGDGGTERMLQSQERERTRRSKCAKRRQKLWKRK